MNPNFALQTLIYARERETLLMETEILNSVNPEVFCHAKNIEHLGNAIGILKNREQVESWLVKQQERCEMFLLNNGFEKAEPIGIGNTFEGNCILVDISDNAITLLDENGDFGQCSVDYYALIGILFNSRIISSTYKQVKL